MGRRMGGASEKYILSKARPGEQLGVFLEDVPESPRWQHHQKCLRLELLDWLISVNNS